VLGSDGLSIFFQTPAERVKAKMKLQLSETGFGPLFVYVLVFPVCSVK
jgi:hypothetical protein